VRQAIRPARTVRIVSLLFPVPQREGEHVTKHLHLRLATVVVAVLLLVPATAQAATKLTGKVGPGFTITLTKAGHTVTSLPAGTYKIAIHDNSNIHNFHLSGPGLNKLTDVAATGTTTWKLKLKTGTYHYQCDPHASSMKGSFRVS